MPPATPATQATATGDAADGAALLRTVLFDADHDDRTLQEAEVDPGALGDRQLLWLDVEQTGEQPATALVARLAQRLGLGDAALAALRAFDGHARVQNFGDWFVAQAIVVEHEGQLKFTGRGLAIVSGRNFVLTVHRGPLAFMDQLRTRERADTRLGMLSAESFTASLLDWQLVSYFDAVSDFEAAVDRLEVGIMTSRRNPECLPELAELRRGASRLRRMLAPHRNLFSALARPDFRPDADGDANAHFIALDDRFARAMDAVENARDLVVGSFELFTTRTAQRTNDTMRVLTVVTVLLGTLAVVAGVLGMNFPAPFFDSGARGFWTAVGTMAGLTAAILLLARWRRWL
jgi:Mg2+ and Co2+ transporter CorA